MRYIYRNIKLSPRLLMILLIINRGLLHPCNDFIFIQAANSSRADESYLTEFSSEILVNNLYEAGEMPDTNFTYEKYAAFLAKISDTSKYIVLPINDFRTTINSNKIVIGLRHDVDNDLNVAYLFSETESNLGFRSTYYILHTAPYYRANPGDMAIHSEAILPVLLAMQNDRHFEIGWHNDLVTLQAVYKMDPYSFLSNELTWLRSNGINIYGSSSHGSNYCYSYQYLNYYFFEECTFPIVGGFVNNVTLPVGGVPVPMIKGKFSDFGLEYEAYFLNNNKYFSDASIVNGTRWNIGMLDLTQLRPGDRAIILLHPIHWHKALTDANILSFKINGQLSSSIDAGKSVVSVKMPYGTNRNSLTANFTLSESAYARVSGKVQVSGTTINNYNTQVSYQVFAENRDIQKEWKIEVNNAKNSEVNFESFDIPGFTRSVNINRDQRTIELSLSDGCDLSVLQVNFTLSPGANAWIGNTQQFSGTGTVDFTSGVQYLVRAEDGTTSGLWTVSIIEQLVSAEKTTTQKAGLLVYPNPSNGKINLMFKNITTSGTLVDIFNLNGEKVLTIPISGSGTFIVEADLTDLSAGVYILRCTQIEKPLIIIIE